MQYISPVTEKDLSVTACVRHLYVGHYIWFGIVAELVHLFLLVCFSGYFVVVWSNLGTAMDTELVQ